MIEIVATGQRAARRAPFVQNTEWLKVLPPATRFAFYGNAQARAAVQPIWGVEFSEQACRAHATATRATLWMGPDEYLLLDFTGDVPGASSSASETSGAPAPSSSEPGTSRTLAADLEVPLTGIPHALVDISHRQFALAVSGTHAAAILNGACPLDLDLAEFPINMCTRTVFAKADIVLWRTAADTFHLEVWRSFAGYVTGILAEIASEFYP